MTHRLARHQSAKYASRLGRDLGTQNYSEERRRMIAEETKSFALTHQEAFDILEENCMFLDSLVLKLMDKETLYRPRSPVSSRCCTSPAGVSLDLDRLTARLHLPGDPQAILAAPGRRNGTAPESDAGAGAERLPVPA